MLGSSTDNNFSYRMLIFAIAILFLMPTMISIYTDNTTDGMDENIDDLLDGYYEFTGSEAAQESVWALTGIYTPYTGQADYGYTDDGWLYGSIVGTSSAGYSPDQYEGDNQQYTVQRGDRTATYTHPSPSTSIRSRTSFSPSPTSSMMGPFSITSTADTAMRSSRSPTMRPWTTMETGYR